MFDRSGIQLAEGNKLSRGETCPVEAPIAIARRRLRNKICQSVQPACCQARMIALLDWRALRPRRKQTGDGPIWQQRYWIRPGVSQPPITSATSRVARTGHARRCYNIFAPPLNVDACAQSEDARYEAIGDTQVEVATAIARHHFGTNGKVVTCIAEPRHRFAAAIARVDVDDDQPVMAAGYSDVALCVR